MTASSFLDGDASRLRIDTSCRGDAITLRLSGEADVASAEELARRLASLRLDAGAAVRLDVTALRFVDTTTVATLAVFARSARSHGHSISTRGSSALFRRIAELLGLTDALGLPTSTVGHQIPLPPNTFGGKGASRR